MAARQQYIFNDKTIGITTIQFKNVAPFENVEKIVFFKETGLKGNWLKKEFRFSFDNVIWSSWRTFSQTNVTKIEFNNQPNFWIEIIYARKNYNSAGINDIYFFYDSNISGPIDPSTGTTDADTLQGQPGSYYLDRANFTGPYTGLDVQNMGDASTYGVYFNRDDSSAGTTLYFKAVEGEGLIKVTESSTGVITIFGDPSIIGGVAYENDDPVEKTVGGINSGETFFSGGKSFAETMEAIFYPVQNPNLSNPSLTFNDNISNLVVIGDTYNITYTANFSRGSISPQYPPTSSPSRSGPANTYHYVFFGTDASFSFSSSSDTQIVNHTVTQGNQSSSCYVSYDGGVQPYNSKGEPYNSPLPAGDTATRTLSFEGVLPLYATTVNLTTLTEQSLVSMLSGNNIELDLVAENPFDTPRQKFEIPNIWLGSRPLIGVETYNTLTSSWEYEGGSAAASLAKWVTSSVQHVINGTRNYTRYSYNDDKRGAAQIRLKF
jgi:hypothetical protein